MTVILYKCSDDPRTLEKTLTDQKKKDCKVYGNCSLQAPTLLLRYDSTITQHNYMYIAEWNRYYFIDNISVDNGKQMIISASVDVLMTYRDSIKSCNATCIRNEGIGKPTDVPDSSFPIKPSSNYMKLTNIGTYFSPETEGYDRPHYLLATK